MTLTVEAAEPQPKPSQWNKLAIIMTIATTIGFIGIGILLFLLLLVGNGYSALESQSIDEYNTLVDDYNSLMDDYDALSAAYDDCAAVAQGHEDAFLAMDTAHSTAMDAASSYAYNDFDTASSTWDDSIAQYEEAWDLYTSVGVC